MKKVIVVFWVIVTLFTLCSCGTVESGVTDAQEVNSKDINYSIYSREELIVIRDTINEILNEKELSNSDNSSSLVEDEVPAVTIGEESPVKDFIYASNGSEVQINGYTGLGGVIVIPEEIDGLPVTRIAQKAFYDCETITGLVLPETLQVIGDWAFGGVHFNDAGVLVLPKSIKEVGTSAFAYSGFSGIVIKCSCTFTCAFEEMRNLKFMYIEEGAQPTLSTRAFGYGDSLTTAVIPASVTEFKEDDIFKGSNKVTIYTPEGSAAATYGTNSFIPVNTEEYNKMIEQYSSY